MFDFLKQLIHEFKKKNIYGKKYQNAIMKLNVPTLIRLMISKISVGGLFILNH